MSRLNVSEMSDVLSLALREKNLLSELDTSAIFYDLSRLEDRIAELHRNFPRTTLHAIAVKANPLVSILRKAKALGVGVEVASLTELTLAVRVGFSPDQIVFDSPVKTVREIEHAMCLGVYINADSLPELDRIAKLRESLSTSSTIGIRINPQVGMGSILSTSVAGMYSKFGVPLTENREELIARFMEYEWLTGVHLHIGSQGCDLSLLLRGIEVAGRFVNETNGAFETRNISRRIETLDIGGGLPVSYRQQDTVTTMVEYGSRVSQLLDQLSLSDLRLITEFGRYVYANTGWVASRVEYVKKGSGSGVDTVVIHVGADMFLRRCYRPDDWFHEITLLDHFGRIKRGDSLKAYNIAGPLCFADDLIARDIKLATVEEGDHILIHDAGAYTLSMWSKYNSRQIPKVIGYYENGRRFELLRDRESVEKACEFWS